jgi:hypothetical protein
MFKEEQPCPEFCEVILLKQAKIREFDTHRKILHLRLTMLWLRDHPHLARNHPCSSQLIDF